MTRIAAILLVLLAAASAMAPHAQAQGGSGVPNINPGLGTAKQAPRQVAPPALPGSRAEPTAVAPREKSSLELPPNEALFDSVNRGDLPGAKEAVSRGADLESRNVLGLTPVELAVDLGRNQISFYLLSLRGAAAGSTVSGEPPAARPPTRAERLAADRATRAASRDRGPIAEPLAPAPLAPRLFVGGGAPIPQIGFLGFEPPR